MKKFLMTLTLMLTLGLSFQGVAAQLATDLEDELDMETPDGLVYAYSRTYMPDIMALMADPEFDMETFDFESLLSEALTVMVYGFETNDAAQAFLEQAQEEVATDMGDDEEVDAQISDLDADFGHDGVVMEMSEEGFAINLVVFLDDTDVFIVMAMGTDADTTATKALTVAESIRDGESETDEITFAEDGSTGGPFDRMPQDGDGLVDGLTVEDSDMMDFLLDD